MRKEAQTIRSSLMPARLPLLAVAFLLGDLVLQCLPALPSAVWLLGGLALGILLTVRWPRLLPLLFVVAGFTWSSWQAQSALSVRLPDALAGQDFDVVGTVSGLPDWRDGMARFRLRIEQVELDGQPLSLGGQLRLAWYGDAGRSIQTCQRWRLRLRLKPLHGMLNPGGRDSELHALQQRIAAVGYVRDEGPNALVADKGWCVDRLRARLADAIATRLDDSPVAPLLQALAVGDTRGLDDQDWRVARATGVSHLLAISGFHIGVAALLGMWLAGLVWRLLPHQRANRPRQLWQAGGGFALALAYALLAGMGLPTRRALIMIGVLCLARLGRRSSSAANALALALLGVLVLDPLAVVSAGMWLSFAGVAFLLLGVAPAAGLEVAPWRHWLLDLGRAQWLMSVALLPLSVWFFGQASVLGAPANLVAIPLVSLLVVPLSLLACLAWLVWEPLAGFLWHLAGILMTGLWSGLEHLASWPAAQWFLPQPVWPILLLALLGALWMLIPGGLPIRWLGALLFLPLLVPLTDLPAQGGFQVAVLDVGQGLSVLVRTRDHSLLYDAGARYPSGFDLGEAVVVPALHALGVRRLDRMVISHADNDHAGGAEAVAATWPSAILSGSEPSRSQQAMDPCRAGQAWHWDGVEFRMLHPRVDWPQRRNDGSCVLLVSGTGGRILLTGDISRLVEPDVAERAPTGPPLVLLAPHHGSRTSSSEDFLAALAPRFAVVSAGWGNRFGHPAPATVERYHAAGIPLFNTATGGALLLDFPPDSAPVVRGRLRCDRRRYWRHEVCPGSPNRAPNTAIMRSSIGLPE